MCFYLEKTGRDTSSINFLPLVSLVEYVIIYSIGTLFIYLFNYYFDRKNLLSLSLTHVSYLYFIGFGPLPWAVMGEMFPSNVKSIASTLVSSFCWGLAFLITRFFNDFVETLGNDYTFWIFGSCCIVAIFFIYFIFPETKGKSLAEIQKLLNS